MPSLVQLQHRGTEACSTLLQPQNISCLLCLSPLLGYLSNVSFCVDSKQYHHELFKLIWKSLTFPTQPVTRKAVSLKEIEKELNQRYKYVVRLIRTQFKAHQNINFQLVRKAQDLNIKILKIF